jgi:chemotaxis regulatin CheY-phosphate phosphatase CheZ
MTMRRATQKKKDRFEHLLEDLESTAPNLDALLEEAQKNHEELLREIGDPLDDPKIKELLEDVEQRLNSKAWGVMEAMLKDPKIDIAADLLKLAHSVLVTVQKISGEDKELSRILKLLEKRI